MAKFINTVVIIKSQYPELNFDCIKFTVDRKDGKMDFKPITNDSDLLYISDFEGETDRKTINKIMLFVGKALTPSQSLQILANSVFLKTLDLDIEYSFDKIVNTMGDILNNIEKDKASYPIIFDPSVKPIELFTKYQDELENYVNKYYNLL